MDTYFTHGMFKKMKEKITDEVNSATNKIQNMQILDQLTSSIRQQISEPNQLLPTPQDSSFPPPSSSSSSSNFPAGMSENNHFSLIDDGPIIGYNEDDEINNSDISPQHQLFNEGSIKRLDFKHATNPHKTDENGVLLNQNTGELKTESDNWDQQNDHLSVSGSDKSIAGSPQPLRKASNKIRDLERLLAKCKESLRTKNSQIQSLKESLSEVERFKDYNRELKKELAELREAHETWTVSIAESKRAMHQEMENKNAEVEQAKAETSEVQSKLTDSNNKIRQLKSTIQDLESRLVSTSAAHQKERESLTKELTLAKNTAIRQLQKEHEHILERTKLDLEKLIESLKLDMLKKDEQIVTSVTKQEELKAENLKLNAELEASKQRFEEQEKQFNESLNKQKEELKETLSSDDRKTYEERIKVLEDELVTLNNQLEEAKKSESIEAKQEHDINVANIPDSMEFEYLKNIGEYSCLNISDNFLSFSALKTNSNLFI